MSIVKKLAKVGSSYAIILDKSLMELLDIKPASEVQIKTDGTSLIITPYDKDMKQKKIDDVLGFVLRENGVVYKKLAE